jgi:pimeloyl-ACP methyl ester carboxylesterase
MSSPTTASFVWGTTVPDVIIVVPAGVADWKEPEGTVSSIESFGDVVYRAGARYDELDEVASAPIETVTWSGSAAKLADMESRKLATRARVMSQAAVRVGRAVTSYSEERVKMRAQDADLRARRAFLDERCRRLEGAINAAGEAEDWMIEGFRDRAASLEQQYARLQQDVDELLHWVRQSDEGLIAALQAASSRDRIMRGDDPSAAAGNDVLGGKPFPQFSDPGDAATWWKSLTPEQQQDLLTAFPGKLGAMDGLPAVVRDEANRLVFDQDTDVLTQRDNDGTMRPEDERTWKNVKAANDALKLADKYEDPIDRSKPGGFLYMYDPRAWGGDGKIAIAIGNPDTAGDVAVRVPGLTNDMGTSHSLTNDAINVYDSMRYAGSDRPSSMMWLGYDAPDGPADGATTNEHRAIDGGGRLARTLDGMSTAAGGESQHLTVIGHSYGSTTVAHGATDHDLPVDDIVLVASPGAGSAEHARDLGVGEDHVYVGANSRDPIADLGNRGWFNRGETGLGNDPSEDDFGANRFRAEDPSRLPVTGYGGVPGIVQHTIDPLHLSDAAMKSLSMDQHGGYFRPNSESLSGLGHVAAGDYEGVQRAGHVHDPWYGGATDPENWRSPERPVTQLPSEFQ